jgi:hypothetical protein
VTLANGVDTVTRTYEPSRRRASNGLTGPAWRGVAPAGSVHAVGVNGTLHDGAEQARGVSPAEAPPSSWWL